jgi:hypothetical protein
MEVKTSQRPLFERNLGVPMSVHAVNAAVLADIIAVLAVSLLSCTLQERVFYRTATLCSPSIATAQDPNRENKTTI